MSAAATAARINSEDDEASWSLSVKAIGSTLKDCTAGSSDENGGHSELGEKNFTVTVSPDDALTKLYDQIEGVTGLKASQQRLIYRGRLIEAVPEDADKAEGQLKVDPDEEPKIKDIVGLGDGHTIHLVKRKEKPQSDGSNTPSNGGTAVSGGNSNLERDESLSGNGTASLLAALIGLGGLDDDTDGPSTATEGRSRLGLRSGRLGRNRNRPHYRLTAEDLQAPDPGSLEPVRQGLMTIHTMLPHAQVTEEVDKASPLEASRRWYRGQWIDVRDTVNQWLEATIVDIVMPDEILPAREDEHNPNTTNVEPILEPATDPAVSAGDLEGRRRLLLEPCDEGDADDEGGELTGFRRRKTNRGIQLLLIHYNGWPHRWDEWLRSDSERIRPFRTRTRHPTGANQYSPTTQSPFNEAPSTHILDPDNALERPAVLPELCRAVTAINALLAAVAAEETAQLTQEQQDHLPWAVRSSNTTSRAEGCALDISADRDDEDDLEELPPLDSGNANEEHVADMSSSSATHHSSTQSRLRRRQLQMLAPLLDRLGRTLIDAAPHVAALANVTSPDHDTEVSISTAEAVVAPQTLSEDNPSTLGGLLSLLSRDRRRQSNNNSSDENDAVSPTNNDHPWPVDPDYVDFATGSVNTTRGEVRRGPRGRSSSDDVAGLLGAYLAAASLGLNPGVSSAGGNADNDNDDATNLFGLGRLLRDRGNNGGNGAGIDIHIHAVVTAPGMQPTAIDGGGTGGVVGAGGLGFATFGSPAIASAALASARNTLSPTRERGIGANSLLRLRTPVTAEEDEDFGIFSDLYSESPEPVDPTAGPVQERSGRAVQERSGRDEISSSLDTDFLSRFGHASPRAGTSNSGRSDPSGTSPSRHSSTNSDASSSRRSSVNGTSPRRGSMLGRLFRRSRRDG